MNRILHGMLLGVMYLAIVFAVACRTTPAPATPTVPSTAVPAPVVTQSPTSIPRSPTTPPTATPQPSPTLTPTPVRSPTPSTKDMVLAAFAKAITGLKTYRVEVPEEGRYLAFKLPDRAFQEGLDYFLKIGTTTYRYNINGQLIVGSAAVVPFLDRGNIVWLRDQFSQSPQITLLGPGTAEGVPCIGYSMTVTVTTTLPPSTPGATPAVTKAPEGVKIWFGIDDGFPRKVEIGPPTSITENFFSFNEPFDLTPPH